MSLLSFFAATRLRKPAFFLVPAVLLAAVLNSAAMNAAAGDADRGKQLFTKRCGGCHSLDANKEGPQLRHVFGRKAGSVTDFKYSDALKSAPITWDAASLDKWLTDPDSLAQDNDMAFHVPKADERADIIRFLQVISKN